MNSLPSSGFSRSALLPASSGSIRLLGPILLGILAIPGPGFIAAQSTVGLAKPAREFPHAFVSVEAIAELDNGAVLVLDLGEKSLKILDAGTSTIRQIGREGAGPGEYAVPLGLFRLRGDTTAIADPINQRLLLVLPNGSTGATVPLDVSAPPNSGLADRLLGPPQYIDKTGYWYFEAPPPRAVGGPDKRISVPILRYHPVSHDLDTLGFLRANPRAQGMRELAYPTTDEWAVTYDGHVAVVRSPEYQVDWLGSEGVTGSPLPHKDVELTNWHRKHWLELKRSTLSILMGVDPGGGRKARVGPPPRSSIVESRYSWPARLPPFSGKQAVLAAADGNLWIHRTPAREGDLPTYDVVDASARLAMRVSLSADTRVVGFGASGVYTVRTDADGLQYLQLHPLPVVRSSTK